MYMKGTKRVAEPVSTGLTAVRIDGQVSVPSDVRDLESFRRWCRSPEYPNRGDFCWLGGILWADLSMEEPYTHGLVKTEVAVVLGALVRDRDLGDLYIDAMRISEPGADVSCEPDVMFISHESFESGAIRDIAGKTPGTVIEFEGAPDLAVEIISKTSEEKDRELLPERLYAAGTKEFWLIDARGGELKFEIHRRGPRGFVPTKPRAGKLRSAVFGCWFKLSRTTSRRGSPDFRLTYSRNAT